MSNFINYWAVVLNKKWSLLLLDMAITKQHQAALVIKATRREYLETDAASEPHWLQAGDALNM